MVEKVAGGGVASVAYVVSRFPKTTETFVYRESKALRNLGKKVSLFSMVEERGSLLQPEASEAADEVAFLLRPRSAVAGLRWLVRRPVTLVGLIVILVTRSIRHPAYLVRCPADLLAGCQLAHEVRRRGIDHIHAHFATHAGLVAHVASSLSRVPYSVMVHAHDLDTPQPMLDRKLGSATFVATTSERNRSTIATDLGVPQVHVVRCGVPLDRFEWRRPRPTPERGHWEIVCVGALVAYKGHSVLLDACRDLVDAGFGFRCRLIGEGPDRPQVEARIRELHLDGVIELLGAIPSDDVVCNLDAADVFVLPSIVEADGRTEGVPVAAMEALAVGVPAVVSAVAGVPELIQHERTGLLVTPGDRRSLVDALRRQCTDRASAERMSRAGREWVEAEFELGLNAERLAVLLDGRTR